MSLKKGLIAIVIVMFLTLSVSLAYADEEVTLPIAEGELMVSYVGNVDNGDGTVTWTYSVSVTEDLENAISHVSFFLCAENIIDPQDGSAYQSPEGRMGNYTVEINPEGMLGIKFETEDDEGLKLVGEYDILEFTTVGIGTETDQISTEVEAKASTETASSSTLKGPSCEPNGNGVPEFGIGTAIFASMAAIVLLSIRKFLPRMNM
jgi:hypothetical protein